MRYIKDGRMYLNSNNKISIITVTYNAAETIEKTMLSLFSQNYDYEYIIVDGKSTDNTMAIINKYRARIALVISENDEGLYDAMNKGIKSATGDWIFFLNSGDTLYHRNVLYDIFSENDWTSVDVIYGSSIEVNNKGEEKLLLPIHSNRTNRPPMYRHGASFVRRETHLKYLFDLSKAKEFGYGLDYYCICCMYRDGRRFRQTNLIVIRYQKDGLSNHFFKNKLLRMDIEYNSKHSLYYYYYLLNDILSYLFKRLVGER